jgi:hypothetical protein
MGAKCRKVKCEKCNRLIALNHFQRHCEAENRKCFCGKYISRRNEEFCSKRCAQLGKKFTVEHRQKIGEANKLRRKEKTYGYCLNCGKLLFAQQDTYCSKQCVYESPLHRKKLRVSMIQRRLKDGWNGWCSIGKHEKELLNKQEQLDKCKITRQHHIKEIGYITDGYCDKTNTVYEVYETHHEKSIFRDLQRESEIRNHLGCNFIIIWDKEKQNERTQPQ